MICLGESIRKTSFLSSLQGSFRCCYCSWHCSCSPHWRWQGRREVFTSSYFIPCSLLPLLLLLPWVRATCHSPGLVACPQLEGDVAEDRATENQLQKKNPTLGPWKGRHHPPWKGREHPPQMLAPRAPYRMTLDTLSFGGSRMSLHRALLLHPFEAD